MIERQVELQEVCSRFAELALALLEPLHDIQGDYPEMLAVTTEVVWFSRAEALCVAAAYKELQRRTCSDVET